jgi:hypothetical protein
MHHSQQTTGLRTLCKLLISCTDRALARHRPNPKPDTLRVHTWMTSVGFQLPFARKFREWGVRLNLVPESN